ncbi:MAG: tripartite tricarboxylate transporter substrate binding protein [Burkholderiaceae bacterium]|nr:tripartite tricarboxylate transporter substrate binding protein [Burkholderiaceae bacterium]MDO9089958.1 tripartite tricarboxylate transporter substrate binding protein [Burkholderiaceae bacterium]
MKRRQISAALGAFAFAGPIAFAQQGGEAWLPSRPLKLVVPWGAGGINDSLARLAADRMAPVLKQAIAIDNRSGANGQIGTSAVLQAPADGHTLLLITSGQHVLSVALGVKLPYHPLNDLAPLAQIGEFPVVIVVRKDLPASNLQELLALARSKPGKLNVGVSGLGAISHLTAERLMGETGTSMTVVNYRGEAQTINAMLAGEVDVGIIANAAPYVRGRQMKAIASTGATRWSKLSEVPTLIELGLPGFTAVGWAGLAVSAKTPPAVLDALRRAARGALDSEEVRANMRERGVEPSSRTGVELAALMRGDADRYSALVQSRNIKLDSN